MRVSPLKTEEKCLALAFFVIVFAQNPLWPFWDYQSELVALGVCAGLLATACIGLRSIHVSYLSYVTVVSIFFYLFLLQGISGSFRISTAMFMLTCLMIFNTRANIGTQTFELVSKFFAGVLLVSLVFWLLWQTGVALPSYPMAYGSWKGDDGITQLDNFYFFVVESQTLINRFYSVFDEPGVVGTLAALILCGLRFDFRRRRTWLILLGGLFSWSLAFVALSITGFLLFSKSVKQKLFLIVGLAIASALILILLKNIAPGDDAASLLLLYRIVNLSEHGVSSRTDEALNIYFLGFATSPSLLFGEGTNFFRDRPDLLSGQGAIFYLIEYGLIGFFVLLLTYTSTIAKTSSRELDGYFLLLIFLLSFLQRPHMMTPWQLILFWAILCYWTSQSPPQSRSTTKA